MRIQTISNCCASNSNATTFGVRVWEKRELDVLRKNSSEIREIAEYFHRSTEEELRTITASHLFSRKDEKAYNILKAAINLVNLQKENWKLNLSMLKLTESTRELNESEKSAKADYETKINDLNCKFNNRTSKFQYENYDSLPETKARSSESMPFTDGSYLDREIGVYF